MKNTHNGPGWGHISWVDGVHRVKFFCPKLTVNKNLEIITLEYNTSPPTPFSRLTWVKQVPLNFLPPLKENV